MTTSIPEIDAEIGFDIYTFLMNAQDSAGLSDYELCHVLKIPQETLTQWSAQSLIPTEGCSEQLWEHLWMFISCCSDLETLIHDKIQRVQWLRVPHPPVFESSPLHAMMNSTEDLRYCADFIEGLCDDLDLMMYEGEIN